MQENPPAAVSGVPLRAWPAQAGLALADLRAAERLTVIAVAATATTLRAEGRLRIREALRDLLGALLDLPAGQVPLQTEAGQPPRLDLPGRPWHLSISHDEGLVLAAIDGAGRVGVDHMRVRDLVMDLPDWQALAGDYLGPPALARLLKLPLQQRASAFAREWTHAEAALKCAGLGLREWDGAHATLFDGASRPLQFDAGDWIGSVFRLPAVTS